MMKQEVGKVPAKRKVTIQSLKSTENVANENNTSEAREGKKGEKIQEPQRRSDRTMKPRKAGWNRTTILNK